MADSTRCSTSCTPASWRGDPGRVGEVDRDAGRLATDLTGDRLGAPGVAARHDHGAVARGVALGDRPADTGRAADDDDRSLGHAADTTSVDWSNDPPHRRLPPASRALVRCRGRLPAHGPGAARVDSRRRALRGVAPGRRAERLPLQPLDGVRRRRRLSQPTTGIRVTWRSCAIAGSPRSRSSSSSISSATTETTPDPGARCGHSRSHRRYAARAARAARGRAATCRCSSSASTSIPAAASRTASPWRSCSTPSAAASCAPGDTIVEATAGNTGVGLALVAGAARLPASCA